MTGDDNPKKKKRRLIRIVGSLLSLAVLAYIAIALIEGREIGLSRLSGLFSSRDPAGMADEYHFDVGRHRVFADLGGPIASAGSLGIQVLDVGGGETLRDPFRMSYPAIGSANGLAIAFDIGGTAVRVFGETKVTATLATDSAIISASINRNGWFCVCTQGTAGYKGVATVYNDKGKAVYSVSLSSGYVLSAALSPDNKSLAVLNLTDDGSRITFYHGLNSETADSAFDLPGVLMLDIHYPPDGDLVAVSTESLLAVDRRGNSRELYAFSGGRLSAYVLDGDFYALHLLDYGVGHSGRLVTLGADGTPLGGLHTERELISMSSAGGHLAVLRSDSVSLFDAGLEEVPLTGDRVSMVGANRILALGGTAALVAGDHRAVVFHSVDGAADQ